jgi:hypothetical protein
MGTQKDNNNQVIQQVTKFAGAYDEIARRNMMFVKNFCKN